MRVGDWGEGPCQADMGRRKFYHRATAGTETAPLLSPPRLSRHSLRRRRIGGGPGHRTPKSRFLTAENALGRREKVSRIPSPYGREPAPFLSPPAQAGVQITMPSPDTLSPGTLHLPAPQPTGHNYPRPSAVAFIPLPHPRPSAAPFLSFPRQAGIQLTEPLKAVS